ncbi:MAG: C4-dicarboxylate transporter DcuC [Eubacteriaceae bacterium]|nr:C4-dicarboxylate transporter DcuC [Eubacteriaceae bacterium]
MVSFLITLACIITVIILIGRGYINLFVFLFMGMMLALGLTIAQGATLSAASSGNKWIDIFELIKDSFISTLTGTGMSILPIYAYATYMDKIQASPVLGNIIAKPIMAAKNPYFVGIFFGVFVIGFMRVAIVSAFAVMALFMSTLYPAILRAGISRESALSAIFVGTCFDWGPADFVIAQHISGVIAGDLVPGISVTNFFIEGSLRVIPSSLIITSLLSGFICQFADKKMGYVFGSHRPQEEEPKDVVEEVKKPGIYAIFPLLPLVFILMFSPIFPLGINISVLTAVLLSLIIVLVIEFFVKKDLKARVGDLRDGWIAGLGAGLTAVVSTQIATQFFTGMLNRLNGFQYLVDLIKASGLSGLLLTFVFSAAMFVMCFLQGGGGVVGQSLAPMVPGIAESMGVSYYALAVPIAFAGGFRCINIGPAAHMQYIVKTGETTPGEILKRTIPMAAIMYTATLVLSLIILR